jgi:hypothetical protein
LKIQKNQQNKIQKNEKEPKEEKEEKYGCGDALFFMVLKKADL